MWEKKVKIPFDDVIHKIFKMPLCEKNVNWKRMKKKNVFFTCAGVIIWPLEGNKKKSPINDVHIVIYRLQHTIYIHNKRKKETIIFLPLC